MAAKQRETRHQLEDGFVVAWDSSEPDEKLQEKLIAIADRQIGGILAGMGGTIDPQPTLLASPSPRPLKSPRRRAA
ncbi:MAG: hypothetical protein M3335_00785 [Actinomycetota bacterium]|nr:hypothetical protein [Actinomycetota bacterium]